MWREKKIVYKSTFHWAKALFIGDAEVWIMFIMQKKLSNFHYEDNNIIYAYIIDNILVVNNVYYHYLSDFVQNHINIEFSFGCECKDPQNEILKAFSAL